MIFILSLPSERPNEPVHISLGSLFDGIGGFPYAGSFFGIKPLWASEILDQAISVTKRHFPGMSHVGNILALDGSKLPPTEIITFGSPCQDLSVAGKRAGLGAERSGLFMEAIRIIFEMREATNGQYPKYAVWENVVGALSSGKPRGSDFKAVLEAFTKTEVPIPRSGVWANAGMVRSGGDTIAWCVYSAQHFGVPQRRKRIFLVASFGAGCPAEVLFVPKSLSGYFAARRTAGQATAAASPGGTSGTSGDIIFSANQRDEVRDLGANSGALQAQPGMKQQTFVAQRCLTPWDVQSRRIHPECGQWPALYGEEGGGHGYAAISDNMGVKCLNPWETQQSRIFTEAGTAPTLAGADGGGGRNPGGLIYCAASGQPNTGMTENQVGSLTCQPDLPIVCEPETARTLTARGDGSPNVDGGPNVVAVGVHLNQQGDASLSDQVYSLTTNGNATGRNAPLVAHPAVAGTLCASGAGLSRPAGMASETDLCVAYAIQSNMINRKEHNGPGGSGISENTSFALTTAPDTHAVASVLPIPINDKATRYNGGGPTRNGDGSGNGLGVGKPGGPAPTLTSCDKHAVGFSDNTKYIVRRLLPIECERLQGFPDHWTAFGHDGKPISDTKRYMLLGNSVAVPCVAYILMGIADQLRRQNNSVLID